MIKKFIKFRFNSYLEGYANENFVKYALGVIGGDGLKIMRN